MVNLEDMHKMTTTSCPKQARDSIPRSSPYKDSSYCSQHLYLIRTGVSNSFGALRLNMNCGIPDSARGTRATTMATATVVRGRAEAKLTADGHDQPG